MKRLENPYKKLLEDYYVPYEIDDINKQLFSLNFRLNWIHANMRIHRYYVYDPELKGTILHTDSEYYWYEKQLHELVPVIEYWEEAREKLHDYHKTLKLYNYFEEKKKKLQIGKYRKHEQQTQKTTPPFGNPQIR